MVKMIKTKNAKYDSNLKQMAFSFTASVSVNWHTHFGKLATSTKTKRMHHT